MNGDDKPLLDRVRDNEESIRTLNRMGGETVAALHSLHKRLSKSHEYALRDNRLTAEDNRLTAEELKKAFKEYAEKIEIRISALEHWRIYLSGAVAILTVIGGVVITFREFILHKFGLGK